MIRAASAGEDNNNSDYDGESETELATTIEAATLRRKRVYASCGAPVRFEHVALGAGQRPVTIEMLMQANAKHAAFSNFGRRLERFMAQWLHDLGVLQSDQRMQLYANDKV